MTPRPSWRSLVRRAFGSRVPEGVAVAATMEPRKQAEDGRRGCPRVFLVDGEEAPRDVFGRLEPAWGSDFRRLFAPEHRVLIKVNLNTADPYPASTSPEMLAALVDFLRQRSITRLVVGDCSSSAGLPTRRTARRTGVLAAISGKAEMACFDEGPWVRVAIPGRHLRHITVPRVALEVDRVICLANMKTHRLADFSLGLKLAVGFLHPDERPDLHADHLREKAVEVNLGVPADLTIIDGLTAFISGGPSEGETARGGVVIAGTDALSVDVEAYRRLYAVKRQHGRAGGFSEDPFEMAQLRHAREIGLGSAPWAGYECIPS